MSAMGIYFIVRAWTPFLFVTETPLMWSMVLLMAGTLINLVCTVYGGILDLATLGLTNYVYYGVSNYFFGVLGFDIKDEIGLSISY